MIENKPEHAKSEHRPQIEWASELSDILRWLNDRAWPLGGGLLFTATIYLHHYIHVAKVPLSITSTAFVTALPTMLALIVWLVVILTGTFLMPTAMLYARVSKGGPTLAESMFAGSDETEGKRRRRRLLYIWLSGPFSLGLTLWLASEIIDPDRSGWLSLVVVAAMIAAAALSIALFSRHIGVKLRDTSAEFRLISFSSAFLQVIVLAVVISLFAEVANGFPDSFIVRGGAMVAIALLIGFIQAAATRVFIETRSHVKPIARAGASGGALLEHPGSRRPAAQPQAAYSR